MQTPVKYRKEIEKIWRTRPDEETRLNKLRLDKNERISAFSPDFWKNAINDISEEMVLAYPEVFPLYKRLATFHGLAIENFLLTAGSDAAIRHCYEAFVSPGNKVIYLDPTFAMVTVYGSLFGAEMVGIKYDSSLQIDVEQLKEAIDDNTALIIIANPNSPTGTLMNNVTIAAIAEKAARHRVPVLIDEAYYGFCCNTALEIMGGHQNVILTRTFSKVSGMAGLRVGYAVGHPEVISLLTKFRPMYEVNSIGIMFTCKMLDNWHMAEEYGRKTIDGRKQFVEFLSGCGFPVIDTETNFIHVDFGGLKETMLRDLADEGVLVRGMLDITGLKNYTRFTVGPWEVMSRVAEIIHANFSQKS
jgi:histidinol-phosphate aminotransferase